MTIPSTIENNFPISIKQKSAKEASLHHLNKKKCGKQQSQTRRIKMNKEAIHTSEEQPRTSEPTVPDGGGGAVPAGSDDEWNGDLRRVSREEEVEKDRILERRGWRRWSLDVAAAQEAATAMEHRRLASKSCSEYLHRTGTKWLRYRLQVHNKETWTNGHGIYVSTKKTWHGPCCRTVWRCPVECSDSDLGFEVD